MGQTGGQDPVLRLTRRRWLAGLAGTLGAAGVEQTDVYVAGRDGYHSYRIPSLLATRRRTLLAFCEGRRNSRSDTGDID